uniref:Uncharacterized protein n=1 Tax=Acrobeloides nanus TaxID=290746 RepID=A0A914CLQ9_9BILA
MLFLALTIQLAMIVVLFFLPVGILEMMALTQFNYASLYEPIALFPILLYPIIDVIVLMYFVKPYRTYVKELYGKFLRMMRLKKTEPIMVDAVQANILNKS